MTNLFENPADLSEYLFRIVDNGGSSADRYTVVFSDGSYLALSGSPTHPQGVSMSGEKIDPQVMNDWIENGEAVDLALGDLPAHLVQHIISRNNEGFRDFLELVETRQKDAVARNRAEAEANEGIHDCAGKGIYSEGDFFMVKLDGHPDDDRGPFTTARQALLATLPDQYGLAGEEYHSSLNVMRMDPDEAVLKAVAELEEKADAAWNADMTSKYGS